MTKRLLQAVLLLLIASFSRGQLISTYPAFIRDTDSISITFDVSKGNRAFFNVTDTAYVHIGVVLGNNATPWDSVRFVWATTNPLAKATYLGNNKYRYTIPNIRTFFNVPAGVPIRKIAVLLRDASGNRVQRNRDGSDMYIPLSTADLDARFNNPPFEPLFIPTPEPLIKNVGDALPVEYISNKNALLEIFYDGASVASQASSTSITTSLTISTPGNHVIVGRATDGAVSVSDTIRFFVSAPTAVLPQPAGTRDGINYEPGDTSVILVLHAPGKTSVSILGDFNNWQEGAQFQMNKTPDGKKFWLRITALTPGQEYGFQYLVNSSLKIADPYTEKVLDPNNDQFIEPSVYPNLKPYPTGKTSGIVSILQTPAPDYTWQVPNFNRPDKRNLIIYELLLRDFVAQHDWRTLKDTLSYLKRLGVNAIELLPFNEFEGNISWGYNPSFYFAPDKYYGPENRLKEFIDECHRSGIAVIMDIALNHSFGQSPLVQLYFDAVSNRPSADNPWFNPVARHAFNVGYDMNHESPDTKYFTSRVVEHWLQEYKIDGFRFDLSKGFTQKNTCDAEGNSCNVENWSEFDASRIAIWKAYYDSVQLKSNGAYVILEHFAANIEEIQLANYGMLLWGNLNHAFGEAAMGNLQNSNFEGALHTIRGWEQPHLIGYMESHDEERLMYKMLTSGNSSSTHNIRDLNTALRRMEMSSAFLLMMPGPKMIWQFGETGYQHSINRCANGSNSSNCRTDPKPIHWEYMNDFYRRRLYQVNSALISLRKHPSFEKGFMSNRVERNLAGAIKTLKVTTDTSNILVVGNFDVNPATASVTFQNAGTWYDYLTGATFNATGSSQSITMQPGEFHVYLNRNVTQVLTPVTNVGNIISPIALSVYPNPVKKQSVAEYSLPENGNVQLSVVNTLGRQVGRAYRKFMSKGVHKVELNSLLDRNTVVAGTYFLIMEFNGRRETKLLVIE